MVVAFSKPGRGKVAAPLSLARAGGKPTGQASRTSAAPLSLPPCFLLRSEAPLSKRCSSRPKSRLGVPDSLPSRECPRSHFQIPKQLQFVNGDELKLELFEPNGKDFLFGNSTKSPCRKKSGRHETDACDLHTEKTTKGGGGLPLGGKITLAGSLNARKGWRRRTKARRRRRARQSEDGRSLDAVGHGNQWR